MQFPERGSTLFILLSLSFMQIQQIFALDCYVCDKTTENCDTLKDLKVIPCTNSEERCFTKLADNNKVERGCLLKTEEANCKAPTCLSSDKSNDHLICKKCDSKTDVECAQSDALADKYNAICQLEQKHCISDVQSDKTLKRDCASDTDKTACDAKQTTCETCQEGNCNKNVFPKNRKKCHHCKSGEKCNDLTAAPTKLCALYEADDQCYIYGDTAETMVRGCKSDAEAKCKEANAQYCLLCGDNDCNTELFTRKQNVTCHQCNSKDTKECEGEQAAANAKDCKDIKFYEKDNCFTQRHNGVIYRGCYNERSTDLGVCDPSTADCHICADSKGCNSKAASNDFTCIRCRSDDETDCWNDADKIGGKACLKTTGSSTEGCFHGIWSGIAVRGCMIDADERVQYTCKNPNDNTCRLPCTTANCNNQKSGATAHTVLKNLVAAGILLALLRFFV